MNGMRAVATLTAAVLFLSSSARGSALDSPQPGGEPWSAAQTAALGHALDAVLALPTLAEAHVGVIVADTARGTVLYTKNPEEAFVPASTFKLLVASAALERLGNAFTFKTSVAFDGSNLYLRGGGDAKLTTADLAAAAGAVAAAHIARVRAIVVDSSHDDAQRYGDGWSWDDLPYGYAPVVDALSLEENVVHLYVSPGRAAGDPVRARADPQSGSYVLRNFATTGPAGSPDTTDVSRVWSEPRTIALTGSYPLGSPESDDLMPAVPDPATYAGDVFEQALHARGIATDPYVRYGRTPSGARVIWTHESEPLERLLPDFLQPSDNLIGELLLKELGVAQGGEPGTDANGAMAERDFLRSSGVDPATVTIADGSGLSSYDRITAADLLAILTHDWNGPQRQTLLDALPVSGVRGTLKDSFLNTPAQERVWAKTGSMNHVRTIAGFVETKTHGPLTVVFLVTDWMGGERRSGDADMAAMRAAFFTQLAVQ